MEEVIVGEVVLTDNSESELINECEQEIMLIENLISEDQQHSIKIGEKRLREKDKSEDSSEDGFITMTRRRPKKTIKSKSYENVNNNQLTTSTMNDDVINIFEVCLTSLQILPKQMALAKLLSSGNIQNVIRIKYKSPYKVFVQFNDKNQAEKLINFPKNKELDIRAQFTDQVSLSYGIIKGVDLDMTEQEILNSFSSSVEIVSFRRLRRVDYDGKWVNSETVRLGFRNPTCPDYVFAYGCRFKVERYNFPVTQCSGCWKYGHHKKYCPINKNLCPKCGKEHINCDTEIFLCLNCKGPHMALDKTCPFFKKEKRIRILMSLQNTTYKNALQIYINEKREITKQDTTIPHDNESSIKFAELNHIVKADCQKTVARNPANPWGIFSDNLEVNDTVHVIEAESFFGEEEQEEINKQKNTQREEPKSLKKKHKNKNWKENEVEIDGEFTGRVEAERDLEEEKRNAKERKFQWKKIWQSIKKILLAEEQPLMEKVMSVFKVICEEIKLFVLSSFKDREMIRMLFSIIDG